MDNLKSINKSSNNTNNSRLNDQENIPVHVIEDATACVALLILHEVVHCRVRDQSILVDEVLTANLAGEFRDPVTLSSMPLNVDHADAHEAALGARYGLRRV